MGEKNRSRLLRLFWESKDLDFGDCFWECKMDPVFLGLFLNGGGGGGGKEQSYCRILKD